MNVYDVIHGYQPFTNDLVSDWVESNLENVFLPTSKAMADGAVRRSIQLQGWTIDAWLQADARISGKAKTVLANLRQAASDGYVDVGFSAYSHALLPLVGDELAYGLMKADYDSVKEHIGEPTFFWFPECAVDSGKVKLLYERFPKMVAVLPDGALSSKGSFFARIKGEGFEGKAAVANTLVKDVLMNSTVYERPDYVPKGLDWGRSRGGMRDSKDFAYVLEAIDGRGEHIVVRDWENGESRDSLRSADGKADVAAMLDSKDARFMRLSDNDEYGMSFDISDVKPSSWEPLSTENNPFPYWAPADASGWKGRAVDYWLEILDIFEAAYDSVVETEAGCLNMESVDDAFKNKVFYKLFKRTSPALLSCLPWHLLARDEWERFPEFPGKLLEKVVLPYTSELMDYAGHRKEVGNLESMVYGLIRTIEEKA